MVVGFDYSTFFIDAVFLDDDLKPTWKRWPLEGHDAFERTRQVRDALPSRGWWTDEGVEAVGIEDPRGHASGVLSRVQGAILACLPTEVLVQPWDPKSWRKQIGVPGNASKDAVAYAGNLLILARYSNAKGVPISGWPWPQDAIDAFCIAEATAQKLEVVGPQP